MIPPPLLRRIRLGALGLLVVLVALAWSLLGPALGAGLGIAIGGAPDDPGAARAEATPRIPSEIPLSDVHPWGANFFLEREVEEAKREQTVDDARRAGLRWARQHLRWDEVEDAPGSYVWDKYDEIVNLYRDAGLEVILRVDWTPRWAGDADWAPGENNLPADMEDYARFFGAAVEHFEGEVRFFQVWNEPNLSSEWDWRPVDPEAYTEMLAAAASAAREANPDVVVLSAPLAINTETLDIAGNLSDLAYLEGMYDAGAAEHFDVLAANAFGMDRPPEDEPAADRLNFRRVELQREIMEAAGDDETPIWLSEYAWNAAPEDLAELPWQRVSEEEQAAYTVDGVRFARQEDRWPWAGVFSVWYFRREGGLSPSRPEYYFQMMTPDFVPRRVYDAVREHAATLEVAGPGLWEERSAPVTLEDRDAWDWRWDDTARDRNVLVSRLPAEANDPDAALRLRFRGRDLRARLRAEGEATLWAAVDGRLGEPLVLASETAGAWREYPLAVGLSDGEHELELLVGRGSAPVALDAFLVDSPPEGERPPLLPIGLGLAALALGALLLRDLRHAARRVRL